MHSTAKFSRTQRLLRNSGMKVAYLLKTFPKLSETFILGEISELERQGLRLHIFSLREPAEMKMHPGVAQVEAEVTYIPHVGPVQRFPFEKLAQQVRASENRRFLFLRHPFRYVRTLLFYARHGRRKRHLDQALELARALLHGKFTHLHAHFANEPTSVAELAHRLTGCPFSFTAHAKDIYLTDVATADGNFGVGIVIHLDLSTGIQTLVSSGGNLVGPVGIAIDQNGQLVIGDPYTINPDSRDLYDGGIIRINPVGGGQTLIARGQENYVNPRGIAVFRAIGSVKRSQ